MLNSEQFEEWIALYFPLLLTIFISVPALTVTRDGLAVRSGINVTTGVEYVEDTFTSDRSPDALIAGSLGPTGAVLPEHAMLIIKMPNPSTTPHEVVVISHFS